MPRYNRASTSSTLTAALQLAARSDTPDMVYVFATAYGYTIEYNNPHLYQSHYTVSSDGSVTLHRYNNPLEQWETETIR